MRPGPFPLQCLAPSTTSKYVTHNVKASRRDERSFRPPSLPQSSGLFLELGSETCGVQCGLNSAKPTDSVPPNVQAQLGRGGAVVDGSFVWQIVSSVVSLLVSFLAVLCAERVGQMTKTYNDIDAVTRLLEEVSVFGGRRRVPNK